MADRTRSNHNSKYLFLMIVFLLAVNVTLGYLLMHQARSAMVDLMQTKMLDVSNTAAAMIDGDVLERVTPEDEGTEEYASIMRTLTYFQDNIDLRYIYCIRDMGDGTFVFGLDPTVEDPGEFGSPIVYTDALYSASKGTPAADDSYYEDAWGKFYSAYSPVFNSAGKVAGIIAVDFSAEWYDRQLQTLTWTTVIVGLISLLAGAGIVITILSRNQKKIGSLHGQLNELHTTLIQEMGGLEEDRAEEKEKAVSMDELEMQIRSMRTELKSQIAHVHGQAYVDALTGVKSKNAYAAMEEALDEKIQNGELHDFAVVVCDVNGLKKINDTLGHKAGDEYIRKACSMICDIFSHSPVYRVGGDEFAVLLSGRDFENRRALMHELHRNSSRHIGTDEAIVSGGMAEYIPEHDTFIKEIFERADAAMYKEKTLLKSLGAVSRDDADTEQFPDYFTSAHLRRCILVADDAESNREILGDLLKDEYDILYASDGEETLEILKANRDEIALVLLDLYMPKKTGREVLQEMQVNEELMSIPVIVLTVDEEAELDSLKVGAMDFIPKPYPDIDIIKARIAKCIELSETRELIRHTQTDKLTGLFNIGYFYRYVKRLDTGNEETEYDAVVCRISQFYAVREQYGRMFTDLVLRSIGISLKKLARKTGGIGCRDEDMFLMYCAHRTDYESLLQKFVSEVFVEKETADKVILKFGIFSNAGSEKDIEERFVCASIAAESIENDPKKLCGFYETEKK